MSLSSLSSSSSAELGRYSTSSISTQLAPVISYSSTALMPTDETAPSCSLPERKTQLADRNILHNLPLDVLGDIFNFFSNEDYLAFSKVNSFAHNLIWKPNYIYENRSYRSFLANILVNFYMNAPILKEEEFAPMINLVVTEEIQKFLIERFMTEEGRSASPLL